MTGDPIFGELQWLMVDVQCIHMICMQLIVGTYTHIHTHTHTQAAAMLKNYDMKYDVGIGYLCEDKTENVSNSLRPHSSPWGIVVR